jgi:L-seryl-tRNA(Ser) seleniumtransferase
MPAPSSLPGPGEASDIRAALAALPAVDRLLNADELAALAAQTGVVFVKRATQDELAAQRERIQAGAPAPDVPALIAAIAVRVRAKNAPRLREVINLTGTVIHTNLGRAVMGDEAIAAVTAAMGGYSTLEYDLARGERGDRDELVEDLLRELTGAEAATVVNNNAAAVVLSFAALAAKKEVLVSRGELIEIGGSFRLPDIMKTAGCKLVEVGTTNRTHAKDFEAALSPKTGLIVKAHWSNYTISGFTAAVDDATLARIAHAHGVPYMVDLGAGAVIDLSTFGLPREPMPQESLVAGADVVTFSGDKLLCGPQAGIIVGTKAAIGRIRKHPLKRALRCSKITLAALEATLRIYASAHRLPERLPTLALLTRRPDDIRAACERVLPALARFAGDGFAARIEACASQIGSGSLPVERLPSFAIVLAPLSTKGAGRALEHLAHRLRSLEKPVIGRIHEQALWLDLRCLRDDAELVAALDASGAARIIGGQP